MPNTFIYKLILTARIKIRTFNHRPGISHGAICDVHAPREQNRAA